MKKLLILGLFLTTTANAAVTRSSATYSGNVKVSGTLEGNARTDGSGGVGNIYSGTWTPTLSNNSSFNNGVVIGAKFLRVGDTVTVSFKLDGDAACGGAFLCNQDISLPIPSNFTDVSDAAGACGMTGASGVNRVGSIFGKVADDEFTFTTTDITLVNSHWYCNATYIIK